MEIYERITLLRKERGESMDEFGKTLGVTRSTISKIERNTRNITPQMFKSICREFGVNENWLRTGEGDMYVNMTPHEEIMKELGKIRMIQKGDGPEEEKRIADFKEAAAYCMLKYPPELMKEIMNLFEESYARVKG